jgi:hypothetical protein
MIVIGVFVFCFFFSGRKELQALIPTSMAATKNKMKTLLFGFQFSINVQFRQTF